jgi:hypothetical protein
MNKPEILATQGTQDEEKQSKNTIHVYVAHLYAQTNTNNVNKTQSLQQTTGGKDEPYIVSMRKS